jgi:hypothetical protein
MSLGSLKHRFAQVKTGQGATVLAMTQLGEKEARLLLFDAYLMRVTLQRSSEQANREALNWEGLCIGEAGKE